MEPWTDRREVSEDSRRWLAAIALGAVALVVLLPGTRPLVREQIALFDPRPSAPRGPDYRALAEKHPGDYQLQFAAAAERIRIEDEWERDGGYSRLAHKNLVEPPAEPASLSELRTRLGGSPSALANLLRLAAIRAPNLRTLVHIPAKDPEVGPPAPKGMVLGAAPGRSEYVRRTEWPPETRLMWTTWEAISAEGEQVDPGNAYFSSMRFISLLALQRDAEALAALRRAAANPRWDEHWDDEPAARWRAQLFHDGHATARERSVEVGKAWFGHYRMLRESASIVVAIAAEAERAGRRSEGLEIRRAVARLGMKMRVGSLNFIGSLIGGRITTFCYSRTGGEPAARRPAALQTDEEITAWRRKQYTDYLEKFGYSDEAAWVKADARDQQQVREMGEAHPGWMDELDALEGLLKWWFADLVILTNLAWLLLIALIAALLGRTRWVKQGRPAPGTIRVAALSLILALALAWPFRSAVPAPVLALLLLLPLLVIAVLRRGPRYAGRAGSLAQPGAALFGAALAAGALAAC